MNQYLTDEQIKRHDQLYQNGWKILEGEIHMHDSRPLSTPGWLAKRKLKKAILLFEQTIQFKPTNWGSMWALGKIYQRLGDDAIAFGWFIKAHQIEPTNADVIREAALCAMNLGRVKEAIEYTSKAIELKSDDAGLVANLALALLLDKKPQEAKEKAENSVIAAPKDVVSRNVLRYINEVISGRKPYPKNFRDIK